MQSIEDRFPTGQTVLSVNSSSYGLLGKVLRHDAAAGTVTMLSQIPKVVLKQHGFGMQLIYHPKQQDK